MISNIFLSSQTSDTSFLIFLLTGDIIFYFTEKRAAFRIELPHVLTDITSAYLQTQIPRTYLFFPVIMDELSIHQANSSTCEKPVDANVTVYLECDDFSPPPLPPSLPKPSQWFISRVFLRFFFLLPKAPF